MNHLQKLIAILNEAKALMARDGNDYSWSSWMDQNQAVSEIDGILAELEKGSVRKIEFLFASTGPVQEVSLRSGWGDEFLELAERFDKEYTIVRNRS